ncbi:Cytochrome c oxidase assembly protein cox19 [Balamuthia mandrillaris]
MNHVARNKVQPPVRPDKGSFPLDRSGECSELVRTYYKCLHSNDFNSDRCRKEAKVYLQCRMDNGLMKKEDLSLLGFAEDTLEAPTEEELAERRERMKKAGEKTRTGFIAGEHLRRKGQQQ